MAARRTADERRRAIVQQRRVLDRVLDRQAMRPMERVFDTSAGQLVRRVARATRATRRKPATAADVAAIGQRARAELQPMINGLGAELARATEQTLAEGMRSLSRFATQMGRPLGQLQDEAFIQRIVQQHRGTISQARADAMARVGQNMAASIQRSLLEAVPGEESIADLVDRVSESADWNWWQVERLVRTETSIAYNTVRNEGIEAFAAADPRVHKRWTEMVDDTTGRPMDNRVGKDSLVLHGQITQSGGLFVMPPDPRAPQAMVGSSWLHPPNRPNDRAVLIPWWPGTGLPGWKWQGGRRQRMR